MAATERTHTLRHRWLVLAVSVAAVLVLDQLTKWWAVRTLAPPPDGDARMFDLVGSLRLRYAENTGMAFSKGAESGRWIALAVIVIVVVMVVVAARVTSRAQVVLLGVVIGGALGNLIDRIIRAENGLFSGAVVDFVDLQWWPVFNVADAAVVCGGIALVWFATREPEARDGPPDGHDGPHPGGSDAVREGVADDDPVGPMHS